MNKPFVVLLLLFLGVSAFSQGLRIPQNTNFKCSAGRQVSGTDILVKWNAPGVKGREGKIWGTDIAWFGTMVLGYGSDVQSPWRAGSDECTTISFSNDVMINGKQLAAGTYAFFIELGKDESVLIFNTNTDGWGSYFYDISKDVLRVPTKQVKDVNPMAERLAFEFSNQSADQVNLALNWEHWSIPMTISVDSKKTTLASIQAQMTGHLGFDPPSLIAASGWCLRNDVNLEQALQWIDRATDANLGGQKNFSSLSIKAQLLSKLDKNMESKATMEEAVMVATPNELHRYGRMLLVDQKVEEAFKIFSKNYEAQKGAWPTTVGMMRAYNAKGDYKKALEFAEKSLVLAPDDTNKRSLKQAVDTLKQGKALTN